MVAAGSAAPTAGHLPHGGRPSFCCETTPRWPQPPSRTHRLYEGHGERAGGSGERGWACRGRDGPAEPPDSPTPPQGRTPRARDGVIAGPWPGNGEGTVAADLADGCDGTSQSLLRSAGHGEAGGGRS